MFPHTPACGVTRPCLTIAEALAQDPYSLPWWGLVTALAVVAILLVGTFGIVGLMCDQMLRDWIGHRPCPQCGGCGLDAPCTLLLLTGVMALLFWMVHG